MPGIPWGSKDISEGIDVVESKVSDGEPSPEGACLGEWTTSRRELWCFYLYYVVRLSLSYFLL